MIMKTKDIILIAGASVGAFYLLNKFNLAGAFGAGAGEVGSLVGGGVVDLVAGAVEGASTAAGELGEEVIENITDALDQSAAETAQRIIDNHAFSDAEKLQELISWANSQRWNKEATIRVYLGKATFIIDNRTFTDSLLMPAWASFRQYMNDNYSNIPDPAANVMPSPSFTSETISRGPYSFIAHTSYEVSILKNFLGIDPAGVDMDSYLRNLSPFQIHEWRDGYFHLFSNFVDKLSLITFLQAKHDQYTTVMPAPAPIIDPRPAPAPDPYIAPAPIINPNQAQINQLQAQITKTQQIIAVREQTNPRTAAEEATLQGYKQRLQDLINQLNNLL